MCFNSTTCAVDQLAGATQFSRVCLAFFWWGPLPWASIVYPAADFHKLCLGVIIFECVILPDLSETGHLHKALFLKK